VEASLPERRAEVATLTMFQYSGELDGTDIGLAVRDKAKEIIEFLDRFSKASAYRSQNNSKQDIPAETSVVAAPETTTHPYQYDLQEVVNVA